VAKFIVEQNERVYVPRGLLIIDPVERGLRVVSFTKKLAIKWLILISFVLGTYNLSFITIIII